MNPLDKIALAKAAEKFARDLPALAVGTHLIDVTACVRVQGVITKSEDTEAINRSAIPLKTVLARALIHAGLTPEAARLVLARAIEDVVDEIGEGETSARMADIDIAITAAAEKLAKKPVLGAVRANLVLTELALPAADKLKPAEPPPKGRRKAA